MQLSSHPLPLRPMPQLLFPQNKRIKIIQIHELLHPNPDLSLRSHPQFVALKSLIISLHVIFIYTSSYVGRLILVTKNMCVFSKLALNNYKHAIEENTYSSKKGTYYYMKRVKKIVHYQDEWLGKDCTVVIMDTGVARHPDLDGRVWMFRDFMGGRLEAYDDNGHGTHVCGIIGGNRIGMAPECKMIVLKVLDHTGNGRVEYSMRAFRWILENREKYNIRVVNISMGMAPKQNEDGERYILGAVELLWDMGIVVVAAAGNLGPAAGSITIPGLHRKIITVGSYDNLKSGQGSISQNILKPDLVAPGSRIFSCNANWNGQERERYVSKSGTSMSTPIVTGAIAQLLSRYPNMPNTEVKRHLMNCCDNLNMPQIRQGRGLLNVQKFLK